MPPSFTYPDEEYATLRKQALIESLWKAELPLDFYLGMSVKQVARQQRELTQAGIIHIGAVGLPHIPSYSFVSADSTRYEGQLHFEFVEEKLAKLVVTLYQASCDDVQVRNALDARYASTNVRHVPTFHLYKAESGKMSDYGEAENLHYIWLDGGQEIDLYCHRLRPRIEFSGIKLMARQQRIDSIRSAHRLFWPW